MENKENEKNSIYGSVEPCPCCSVDLYEEDESTEKNTPILIITLSAVILGLGIFINYFSNQGVVADLVFLAATAISGFEIAKTGITKLLKGKFTINLLITIAAIGAFSIGSGAEGASVMFLYYVAEFLEDYAGERSRKSIESLIKLTPAEATVKREGKNITIHTHAVNVNEIVVIKPGDKIPLDGIVTEGVSSVNQAAITGESIPVTKSVGDEVFAGTLNEEGYFEFKVTKRSNETVISKIVELVKDSQKRKSKTETFIDKFSGYYTPAVILLAVIVAIVPFLVFGLSFDTWFYRALVLLVVSCPCALAISTPVSMISGITASAKNGVLIKGGEYVEELQNTKVMVFDKTGTLTEGELEVTDIIPLNNYTKSELLEIAASLELNSKHPLAKTVIRYAEGSKLRFKRVSNFKSITGEGVCGKIDNTIYYVGKKTLFRQLGDFPDELLKKLEIEGKSTVLVGNEKQVFGVIGFMDKIKELSKNTVQGLRDRKIKTLMLTGDNEGTARAVSLKIGIDEYRANLLPEDKVNVIDELLVKYNHIVMVGDGVNDAPALASSSIGIAMGAAGSDVAIKTADISLMHDDIFKVNYLIDLSKKTMKVVKQNVSASILIKGSFAVLAVFGFITLWMGVAIGDMGLTLAVILNALKIGR